MPKPNNPRPDSSELDKDEEKKPTIIVTKCDPITGRFKRVKTRRIRRRDFYGSNGELLGEE